MKNSGLKRFWGFAVLLAGLMAASAFFACNSTEPGEPTFNIKGDSAWLKLDKILILRADSLGNVKDTLFEGKLKSFDQLKGLPAGDFSGGKAQIIVKGFQGEEETLAVTANFDGSSQKTETNVEKDLSLSPEAVKLSTDTLRLLIGESKEVDAQILPVATSQLFTWSKQGSAFDFSVVSGNSGSKAKVEGKQKGEGSLVVYALKDTSKADTLFVVVDYKPVGSISLSADTLRLKTGGYRDSLQAEVKPATADPSIHFSSSDTAIITVDSLGHVQSAGVGEAWVFARAGERSDSTLVQVVANRSPRLLGLRDTTVSVADTVHLYFKAIDLDGQIAKVGVDIKRNGKLDDTLPLLTDSSKFYHLRRIFPDSGSYLVLAGAMDNDGAIAFDTSRIHVIQDIPTVNAGKDTSGKAGQAITLQGSASQQFGSIVMWKWDFNGDGEWDDSSAATSTLSYTYATDGSFEAKLYARDDDGNAATDIRIVSMGNVLPQFASKRGDTTVSIKDSVAFSASLLDQDGVIKQVAWDFDGDGSYDDSTAPNAALANVKASHRYASAGKYTVFIRGRDNGGGSVKDSLQITVLLDAPIANAGADTTVLTATSIRLHAKGSDAYGSIVKREWQIGTGADFIPVGAVDTTITAPPTPSSITCVLRLTDDDGVVGLDTVIVAAVYDTDSRLSALAGSVGNLAPTFATETLAYTLTIANTVNSVRILPTVRSGRATVKVNGTALSGTPAGVTIATAAVGNYTATVIVTAEDTSKHSTYVVTITKVPSSVKTLSALAINSILPAATLSLTPAFAAATSSYTLSVADTVDSVTVTPTKTNAEASIQVNSTNSGSGIWRIKIDTGVTNITVQVTAGDGSTGNYSVKVYRKAWILVGSAPFISGSASDLSLDFYKGTPVIGHRTGSGFAAMSQLSGNTWTNAGTNPISVGTTVLGSAFVATPNFVYGLYRDNDQTANGKLRLRRWGGAAGAWTSYSGFASDSSLLTAPAMAHSADTVFFAFADYDPANNRRLQVKRASAASSAYTSLGTTVSDSTVSVVAMAVDSLGRPWVAYGDNYSTRAGRLTLKYWNPTSSTWISYATSVSASTVSYLSFTIEGSVLYLSYRDAGNQNKLTVLRRTMSGSIWDNLGGAGFSDGAAYYTSIKVRNGVPYVGYLDYSTDAVYTTRVLTYRNGAWQYVGVPGFLGLTNYLNLALDASERPYLAIQASSPNEGRVIRYFDPQAEGL